MLKKFGVLFDPMLGVNIILKNKDLLKQLVRRNIQARYRGSSLGLLWSFAQPLMMLSVYTFVFSVIFKARWGIDTGDNRAAFAIIMFCGMALFNIFSESVTGSCGVIVGNPNYVKKVIFPLEILPVAQVLSTLILGSVWFILLFLGACFLFGKVSWTMLLLPLPLIPLVLFTCGISMFVASLGVYLRDIQHIMGIVMQVLFFITPIFYPISAVPEKYRWPLQLNPLTTIIEESRKVFLYGQFPDWTFLLISFGASVIVAHLGFVWFVKTRKGFADVI